MTDLNTADYYRGRERKERALADAANSPHIAAIHRQMADSYSELATRGGESQQSIANVGAAISGR